VISPTPRALHVARSRRLNARLENGSPEYPANTNCEAAKLIPPGARIRRPLKPSWVPFHSRERRTQAPWDGHILEDAPFAFDPESDDFLPHPLAIAPRELDQFLKTAGGLKEGIGQMEREGRPVALLPDFEVVEQPTDVGEEEVADLGLLVERRLDLGKRILEVPMLVGKGKRRPNLLEARGVLPLAQETVGFQGDRKRKTPRIQTCSSRPGRNPYYEPFIEVATHIQFSAEATANPQSLMSRFIAQGKAVALFTDGKRGASLMTADGVRLQQAAVPGLPVVDSDGAGDAFFVGYLYGWLTRQPPPTCLQMATTCGGYTVTQRGLVYQDLSRAWLQQRVA